MKPRQLPIGPSSNASPTKLVTGKVASEAPSAVGSGEQADEPTGFLDSTKDGSLWTRGELHSKATQ